jgi:predicted  nucleic acid-binding Zn-ribbon protein
MLRKTLLSLALGVAGLTLSYPSLACDVPQRQVFEPPVRPISSFEQAAELRAQADRMDARAVSDERTADALTREGDVLLARARTLRQQAMQVSDIDRDGLLARAEAVAAQAAANMQQASQLRGEAMQLRTRARMLRDRAAQLVSGGGGWRNRRTASVDVAF